MLPKSVRALVSATTVSAMLLSGNALHGSEPATPPPTEESIQLVTTIQKLLSEWRCYGGPIDGKIGPETRRALSEYSTTGGKCGAEVSDSRTRRKQLDGTADRLKTAG